MNRSSDRALENHAGMAAQRGRSQVSASSARSDHGIKSRGTPEPVLGPRHERDRPVRAELLPTDGRAPGANADVPGPSGSALGMASKGPGRPRASSAQPALGETRRWGSGRITRCRATHKSGSRGRPPSASATRAAIPCSPTARKRPGVGWVGPWLLSGDIERRHRPRGSCPGWRLTRSLAERRRRPTARQSRCASAVGGTSAGLSLTCRAGW